MEEPSSTQPSTPATSRLCVKNLPKYISEKRLKEHFAAKGLITDAKIVKTKDGKSRCFAFIGYRSVEDATAALDYFGGTYIDTARLDVEYAQPFGKSLDHRPWSKYTQGTSSHSAIEAKKKAAEGKEDAPTKLKAREAMKLERAQKEAQKSARTVIPTDDPKLAEFMELMAPRSKKATWGNDDAVGLAESAKASAVPKRSSGSSAGRVAQNGLNQPTDDNEEEESEGAAPSGSEDEADEPDQVKEQVVVDNTVSHLDYLRSRQTGKSSFSDDEDEEDAAPDEEQEEEDKEQESEGESSEDEDEQNSVQVAGEEAEVSETGRLFLRNLAYAATDDELRELLEPYGELEDVHIVKDRATGQSKGFAHVQFKDPQDAVKAQAELDGSIFQGRLLHILAGRPAPTSDANADGEKGAKSFKDERAQAKRENAGKATSAWNSLFVRADTVAEAVAAHFGIPKSALLDKESPDVAVRMALGEAQVFAATKEALTSAGVSVEALEAAAAASGAKGAAGSIQRSDRTILVKNLPWSSDEAELSSLFAEAAGNPSSRFVLPPTKALAVVEFDDAADAKRAFRRLAYKNYQHVPLYLEWAPKTIFSGKKKLFKEKKESTKVPPAATTLEHPESKSTAAATARISADSNDVSGSATIYVKNLAWATQESALRTHFENAKTLMDGQQPQLRSVRIAKKKGPDGKPLSAGYGFVECDSEAGAKALIGALQGSVLEGHKLILQLAQSRQLGAKTQEHQGIGTKMVVRNVAFEATRKDIMALFTAFGDVKSCRLPRKFDGTHRGFAFVEFSSKQETKNALEAVQGTHLYGRRLVIESAEEEGGLEELRAKTAAKFSGILESEGGMKRELPEDGNPDDNRPNKRKKKKAAAT